MMEIIKSPRDLIPWSRLVQSIPTANRPAGERTPFTRGRLLARRACHQFSTTSCFVGSPSLLSARGGRDRYPVRHLFLLEHVHPIHVIIVSSNGTDEQDSTSRYQYLVKKHLEDRIERKPGYLQAHENPTLRGICSVQHRDPLLSTAFSQGVHAAR
jgi:hypothetical protein